MNWNFEILELNNNKPDVNAKQPPCELYVTEVRVTSILNHFNFLICFLLLFFFLLLAQNRGDESHHSRNSLLLSTQSQSALKLSLNYHDVIAAIPQRRITKKNWIVIMHIDPHSFDFRMLRYTCFYPINQVIGDCIYSSPCLISMDTHVQIEDDVKNSSSSITVMYIESVTLIILTRSAAIDEIIVYTWCIRNSCELGL